MRTADAPSPDAMAQQIAWAAEARPGSDLFFVVANTHAGREGFAHALRTAIPDLEILDLGEATGRFLDLLRDLTQSHTVLVTGLEPHARAAGTRGSLFATLNLDRDAIRREDRNLVFLLPAFALTALAQSSPDFYDFRTVTLEAQEATNAVNLAPLRTGESVLALNPRDRARWIKILKSQRATSSPHGDASRVFDLANLLVEQGSYAEAETRLREVIDQNRGRGYSEVDRGTAYNNLGHVLLLQGRLDDAKAALLESGRIARKVYGAHHPETATRINNLGGVLHQQGDLDGALAGYREAEHVARIAYGDDHPKVGIYLSNIGNVLQDMGDLDGALRSYLEAERVARSAHGSDHPETAIALNNIGTLHRKRGDLEKGLAALREAERSIRAVYGDDHPRLVGIVNNVGSTLKDMGDPEGAFTAYREAERIGRKAFGDHHPMVAITVNNVGSILFDQGDSPAALDAYRESFLVLFQAHGPRGLYVRLAAGNVASVGGDPVDLVRERLGPDAARELEIALGEE